jgi:hemolysin activation/secretion protein
MNSPPFHGVWREIQCAFAGGMRILPRGPGERGGPQAAHSEKRGAVSLRHTGMLFALAILAVPSMAPAQTLECEDTSQPGCGGSGPCPINNLPYEEFIASPPAARNRRDIPPVPDRPFDPDSGDKILVKGFVIDGVTPKPNAGLTQETVQNAANTAFMKFSNNAPEALMTVGQIVRIADEVTTFYRGKGFMVAKAFVPVQTIGADSVVHIQVLEGRISEVVVEGNKSYSAKILARAAKDLIGTTPSREAVETALLYAQDYPGVRLFGTFRAGAQPGDTKLVLQVLEEDRFSFKFGADNYGSEFTGTYRLRGDVSWHNPIGLGDELSVTALQAVAPENTSYGALRYAVPFGPSGFGAYVSGSKNAFQITEDPFSILQLEGSITAYEGGFDWRYSRSRFFNATMALAYSRKASQLDAVGGKVKVSDDTINVASLENNIERIDTRFKGLDLATFKIRQGVGADLSGSSSAVDPNFTAYEVRYSRLQALAETQFVLFRLRLQETDSKLSPIEQFAIAGPDAVRAYPVGQVLRDTGRLVTLEYRIQAPGFARAPGLFGRQWGDLLTLSMFGDYGFAENAKAAGVAGTADEELSGYGAGLQFGLPKRFQFLVQWAQTASKKEPVDGDESRVYGELSLEF